MAKANKNREAKLLFEEKEVILCFHGPLLYEAKIIKAENWAPGDSKSGELGPHYFVHYKGWKNTWDEWVSEDRVVKMNQSNLAKQKQLKESHAIMKKRKIGKKAIQQQNQQPVVEKPTPRTKKRQRADSVNDDGNDDGNINNNNTSSGIQDVGQAHDNKQDRKRKKVVKDNEEREKEFMKLPEIQIVLPQRLKEKLIDDWATIMRDKILYHLPCSITVDEILVDYLNYKRGITSSTSGDNSLSSSTSSYSLSSKNASKSNDYTSSRLFKDVHEEITNGIQAYFNTCLDTMLLYDEERVQNEDVHKTYPDKEWSEIYGAEHLLRLFVELPKLLVHTDLDEKAMDILKGHLADFLKSHYFVGMYEHDLSIPPNKKLKSSGKRAAKSYCTNCRTFNSPDWHAGETPDQILCSICALYYLKHKTHRPESLWNRHYESSSSSSSASISATSPVSASTSPVASPSAPASLTTSSPPTPVPSPSTPSPSTSDDGILS
ncbi:14491_t:CDS:10 [Entrophospora sp. SA101]|nr:14491_t:CDS:10 [Entrophospora sp. SA101]CAJ0828084.1 15577_t:CDS:10 [Entrophospora sp. SA101]